MRLVVDLAQAAGVDVAVHLGRRERAMAEQLLDRAEIGAALEQVRRERVTEAVRVRQQAPKRARVQPASSRGEKERILGTSGELGSRLADVAGDDVRGLLSERYDTLLAALAPHVDELLLEVDVREVEVDRLLRAEAGRVDELRQPQVPQRERPVAAQQLELVVDLLRARRVGQSPWPSRGERRVGHALGPERVPQERAHCRELAGDRRRRELLRPRAPEL